jgi:hypothetical protein
MVYYITTDKAKYYLRPHEGLNGSTPAEASGVKIEGENKWVTLIQNAKNLAHD